MRVDEALTASLRQHMGQDRLLNAAFVVATLSSGAMVAMVYSKMRYQGSIVATVAGSVAEPARVDEWRPLTTAGRRMGPSNSPVQIVEFSDFQCPYCRITAASLDSLRARCPQQVAVVYRHFPPSRPPTPRAARATASPAIPLRS